jgi:hypothetical protein
MLTPITKRSSTRRVNRMNNYKLPSSYGIELAASTKVIMPATTFQVFSPITMANLTQDFQTSGNVRSCIVKRATFEIYPPQFYNNATFVAPSTIQTAQIFVYDLNGDAIPISKQKALSNVNPTRMTVNIPFWLTGVEKVGSTNEVLAVLFQSNTVSPTNGITYSYTIKCMADMAADIANSF